MPPQGNFRRTGRIPLFASLCDERNRSLRFTDHGNAPVTDHGYTPVGGRWMMTARTVTFVGEGYATVGYTGLKEMWQG